MNADSALTNPWSGKPILTISQLTQEVKTLIEQGFPLVWVSGEVSNLARPPSGHVYFSLKDAQAQLRAIMYKGVSLRVRFELRDGMEVFARGRLSVYAPRGDYQLQVEEIHPRGEGALELALRQLKEKLSRLGYFAPERKRPLPRYPRRLALVTSPSGAAVRDMLEILTRRWPAVEVLVCPVRVQGDGAAREIAAAITGLNRLHQAAVLPVDVMIIGRGGGSTEDLWAFNEECVAHAIFQSRIPVVSAVGHEIDLTIADMVADRRALTPSEAATAVVPDLQETLHGLYDLEGRMRDSLVRRLDTARKWLDDLGQRPAFRWPLERVREAERRLDDWSGRLLRAGAQRLKQARDRLDGQAARLETLSPLNVLTRGYSLTLTEADRGLVRESRQVKPGDRILTRLHQGQILSRVEEVA